METAVIKSVCTELLSSLAFIFYFFLNLSYCTSYTNLIIIIIIIIIVVICHLSFEYSCTVH